MSTLALAGAALLAVLLGAHAVYWGVVHWRTRRAAASLPSVRSGLDVPEPEGGWPSVTLIIPAYNEERVIEACARGVQGRDYPNLEILFVLDRCTDRTAALLAPYAAEDDRIRVIEVEECPDGWKGKPHALHVGCLQAAGDWLLFADADTSFGPGLVRAAVGQALERKLHLLSLITDLSFEHWFERVAQPVAGLRLMRLFAPDKVQRGTQPFANGQFILIQRDMYDRFGGHRTVRTHLMEDLAIAYAVHAQGGRGGIALADGMLGCSMYGSYEAFRAGWKRIFIGSAGYRVDRMLSYGRRQLVQALFPLVQLTALAATGLAWAAGHTGWAAFLGALVALDLLLQGRGLLRIYRLIGAPLSAILLYPAGCWILGGILLEGARDLVEERPVRWGGLEHKLKGRRFDAPGCAYPTTPVPDPPGRRDAARTSASGAHPPSGSAGS